MKKIIISLFIGLAIMITGCSENAINEDTTTEDTTTEETVTTTKSGVISLPTSTGSFVFNFKANSDFREEIETSTVKAGISRSNEIDPFKASNATKFLNLVDSMVEYTVDNVDLIEVYISGDNLWYNGPIDDFDEVLIPGIEYYISFEFMNIKGDERIYIGSAYAQNVLIQEDNNTSYSMNFYLSKFSMDIKVDIEENTDFYFGYNYYNQEYVEFNSLGYTNITLNSYRLSKGEVFYFNNGSYHLLVTIDLIEEYLKDNKKVFSLSENTDIVFGDLSTYNMHNESFNYSKPFDLSVYEIDSTIKFDVFPIYWDCRELVFQNVILTNPDEPGILINGVDLNISSGNLSIQVEGGDEIILYDNFSSGLMQTFNITCPTVEVVEECDDMQTELGLCAEYIGEEESGGGSI